MAPVPVADDVDVAVPVAAHKAAGWLQRLFGSRAGIILVAIISFLEAALPVPLITDPFLVAAILADRTQALRITIITTAASVLGGLVAFVMAVFFFELLVGYMGSEVQAEFQRLLSFAQSDTFLTTFTGAVTPIPYTIAAWVVAVAGGSVWVFIIGSILGRGGRYALLGYLTYRFGEQALQQSRRSVTISSVLLLCVIGVVVWLKM